MYICIFLGGGGEGGVEGAHAVFQSSCTLYVPKIFTTVRAGVSTNSWVGTSCIFMYGNINDHNDQLTLLSGVFCVAQSNSAETYQR